MPTASVPPDPRTGCPIGADEPRVRWLSRSTVRVTARSLFSILPFCCVQPLEQERTGVARATGEIPPLAVDRQVTASVLGLHVVPRCVAARGQPLALYDGCHGLSKPRRTRCVAA